MGCSKCNAKPEFNSVPESRYALVKEISDGLRPDLIPESMKFNSNVLAARKRLQFPDYKVVVISENRRLVK